MNFLLMISILLPAAFANSESEKWAWPSTADDQKQQASNRKDIYYENANNEKTGRIRVPTSFDDRRRPLQQPYQVRDPASNKPKPLSDEFSNESSGENYSNNINGINGNRPLGNTGNQFGPQQSNDFPGQFGYGQQYPGGFPFPGAYGGQGQFHPGQFQGGQFPIRAGGPIGFPGNIANGILVGPGGPTGIIGRPYGGGFYSQGGQGEYGGQGNHGRPGFFGGFPGAGYGGSFPGGPGFYGQHNGIGGSPFGGQPGISPFNSQFGPGFGPFQRPNFDSTSNNNSQDKVEKSAKSNE